MNTILNILCFLSTFVVVQISAYFVLNFIFGRLTYLNFDLFRGIKVKHFVYFLSTTFFLFKYSVFYVPY